MSSLDIYLAYAHYPHTTAVYFESALRHLGHRVHYVGTPHSDNHGWYGAPSSGVEPRPGFPANVDLAGLIACGFPHPDLVIFVDTSGPYFPRGLAEIDAPTACYLIDVHRNLELESAFARFFDAVFVAQRDFVGHFRESVGCPNVEWIPLACDPEVHGGHPVEAEFDVGFVGNVGGEPGRRRRLELLEGHFSVSDWRVTRPKEAIADVYSRSRVIFNTSVDGDLNMRVFEAMASGRPLVTDRIANGLDNLFVDGTHLLEYGDDAEMIEKIQWCLEHEDEAAEIGRAGQALVLAEHTYERRCAKIVESALRLQGDAPIRSIDAAVARVERARIYSMMRLVDPALDEVADAWPGRGRFRVLRYAIAAAARRLAQITGLVPRIRSMGRRRD